ncbi:tetratricopeptide repeat protein [Lentzea chajnantorensis]
MQFTLAVAHCRAGRFDDGSDLFARSADVYREVGRVTGQARALSGLAWSLGEAGRLREALEVSKEALTTLRASPTPYPLQTGMALHQVAADHLKLGEYAEALVCCAEWEAEFAVDMTAEWKGLLAAMKASVQVGLGDHAVAVENAHLALGHFETEGSWHHIADVHNTLGDAHLGLGEPDAARSWWTKALEAYEYNDHADAEQVRAKLAELR